LEVEEVAETGLVVVEEGVDSLKFHHLQLLWEHILLLLVLEELAEALQLQIVEEV